MEERIKHIKLWISVFSVVVSLAVSVISYFVQGQILQTKLELKIVNLEKQIARHELDKDKDLSKIIIRSDDHEQRIIRLETSMSVMQEAIPEMRNDMKTILIRLGSHGRDK